MLREIGEVAIAPERAVSDDSQRSASLPRPLQHHIYIAVQHPTKGYRDPLVQIQASQLIGGSPTQAVGACCKGEGETGGMQEARERACCGPETEST